MPDRDEEFNLPALARRAMRARNLEANFSPAALAELSSLSAAMDETTADLRERPWCSIDNDDSRDLDQLTLSEKIAGGQQQLLIAVADVDALVKKGSAIDQHAALNTTSIYTPGGVFPMLPERLSTDLTSLNVNVDRLSIVISVNIDAQGNVVSSSVGRARVRNQAQLAYSSVGPWLEGKSSPPPALANIAALPDQLQQQNAITMLLRDRRFESGALDFDNREAHAVIENGRVVDLRPAIPNRATELIADAMIAANGAVARFLKQKKFSAIRRVVRLPKRWDRIVELAGKKGTRLPTEPDGKALENFLRQQRVQDPLHFPDLSLAVVKLMGRGEYILEQPQQSVGHFGLAVRDYAHSTAPNRRYADLVTHRLIKAALLGMASPYSDEELAVIAAHCTFQEDNATKVERQLRKSVAALLLRSRIGEVFDAIVTGSGDKGTWVRVYAPPVEGKLMGSFAHLDVGDKTRVKLVSVQVEMGFIDFVPVN